MHHLKKKKIHKITGAAILIVTWVMSCSKGEWKSKKADGADVTKEGTVLTRAVELQ
jgi:hypothetical protein